MKRLFAGSSGSTAWDRNFTPAMRLLLFVALLLVPGSVIVLPLLGWIKHKSTHTPGAHA